MIATQLSQALQLVECQLRQVIAGLERLHAPSVPAPPPVPKPRPKRRAKAPGKAQLSPASAPPILLPPPPPDLRAEDPYDHHPVFTTELIAIAEVCRQARKYTGKQTRTLVRQENPYWEPESGTPLYAEGVPAPAAQALERRWCFEEG